ncbi:MAG: glycosyltransferase [Chloroflexaceae bacterium]|nr:glycosyltransferase [Chloroflexaceae bacterium]
MLQSSTSETKQRNAWYPAWLRYRFWAGMLVTGGLLAAIAIVWWGRESQEILRALGQSLGFWLKVPYFSQPLLLFFPTLILWLIVQGVMGISPQPQTWSRGVIIGILLALALRYVLWRSLFTLNLASFRDGTVSLVLYAVEMLLIFTNIIQLYLAINSKDRRQEADALSAWVKAGLYTPNVDILIPTYNEPDFILRRTVIGCQAVDYGNKEIYLLDDTCRPEIAELAQKLGCHYLTRPDNRHAKSGNLNHALSKTKGDLIAVFDADFVPTSNFLERTVGFFQREKVALVQTPQSFYNRDIIAKNLGLAQGVPAEEEFFYRYVQPYKDASRGLICAGTSFLIRRSVLQALGGFVTESICEDYFTGVRLAAQGYEAVYLNEKLSAGLAAESISAYISQRMRWARGTLQGLFIEANPLTIPGLNMQQRLCYLESFLSWFNNIPRLVFLLMPLLHIFFRIVSMEATVAEVAYIFFPFYWLQISVFSWLNRRSRSAIITDIYILIPCFYLVFTLVHALIFPFSRGFKVTPKGTVRNQFKFNFWLALPTTIALVTTLISVLVNLNLIMSGSFGYLSLIWGIYNLFVISVALQAFCDAPNTDQDEWFNRQDLIQLSKGDRHRYRAQTVQVSEGGAKVALRDTLMTSEFKPGECLELSFTAESLTVTAQVKTIRAIANGINLELEFTSLGLGEQRRLIEMLYCQPGQWPETRSPGELQLLWLLSQSLFRFS